jgi:hypothetical protein
LFWLVFLRASGMYNSGEVKIRRIAAVARVVTAVPAGMMMQAKH